MDSAPPAIDGDGDHQCGDRGWIGAGAAADRHNSADGGWRMVFFAAGAVGFAWVIWWSISYRGNSNDFDCHSGCTADRPAIVVRGCAGHAQGSGAGLRQVHERFGLVLLSVLAAEVSLRRARLRREARELLCVDTLCGVGSRELSGRMAVQRSAEAGAVAGFLAKICTRPERAIHAGGDAGAARAGWLGARVVQHCVFLPAVLVRFDYDVACGHLSLCPRWDRFRG